MASGGTGSTAGRGGLAAVWAGGALLLGASMATSLLSDHFVYGVGHAERPIVAVVAVLLAAGAIWAVAMRAIARAPSSSLLVAVVLVVSGVLGAVQLRSNPVQEVDFYRYLLDGGVTACGESPYLLTPGEQRTALETVASLTGGATQRAGGSAPCLMDDERWLQVASRVSDPRRPSTHPPLRQGLFAAVVHVGGPSIEALRVAMLMAHLLTVALLAALLARLRLSPALAAVYGWAPLIFKESLNSVHYDGVVALFLVTAGLLLTSRWRVAALAVLGLAAGAEPLTAVLVPLWLRALPRRRLAPGLLAFLAAVALPYVVFLPTGPDAPLAALQGLARHWTPNAPLFGPLEALAAGAFADETTGRLVVGAALMAAAAMVGLIYRLPSREDERPPAVLLASRVVLAFLLIAGPLANPWSFCWLLPLVALDPRPHWLALIAALPLYYLTFYLASNGLEQYQLVVVAAEFLPFVVLGAVSLLYRNRSSSRGRTRSAAPDSPSRKR